MTAEFASGNMLKGERSTFVGLGISPLLAATLAKQSIMDPTPVQTVAIPKILQGADVLVHAATGTGKTLAFLLPLLQRIDSTLPQSQVIVISPTHELALQTQRVCSGLTQQAAPEVRTLLLIGGTSRDRQLEKLKKKPHIVVGTAGRIAELIEARKLKVQKLMSIVIDEADTLLLGEALSPIKAILKASPANRQIVFASASRSPRADEIIRGISPRVEFLTVSAGSIVPEIEHYFLTCDERDKPDVVRSALHSFDAHRAIIFVHRNDTAEIVAAKLAHHKIQAIDLHGAHDKQDRKAAMDGFRSGKIRALIASDVAAKGLDIHGVSLVINLDVPTESNGYLHRAGRTGRAGAKGIALTLLTKQQRRLVQRFERELSISMQEIRLRFGKIEFVASSVATADRPPIEEFVDEKSD